ncbi:MAG: hypothetical protein CVU59_07860 [Deltaproteobacteria bacterium HGW-Deltaproteobacteria-17]|nr:MAG: hypothetical protein CVU59_07860 [Deltaproteobacteria bacterium HGW-Deltaproteobacteria-17]
MFIMIHLSRLLELYPEELRGFRESILKEYLQVRILGILFEGPAAGKLVFMGGTALRLLHGNLRFSEDLDFDNLELGADEFLALGEHLRTELELLGLHVEVEVRARRAYHLQIRFPSLLHELGLSPLPEQKIRIQIDSEAQHFSYVPDTPILNRFDVFARIRVAPRDLLLSQKLYAALHRKRLMGRDFFDVVFLYGLGVTPHFGYLEQRLGLATPGALKAWLLERTAALDFAALAKDVEPFLFFPRDRSRVLYFRDFVAGLPD